MPKAKAPRLHPELAAARRKPKNQQAAWAKAAQQYAGNLHSLPTLHVGTNAPPGPGPVVRPAPSKAVQTPAHVKLPKARRLTDIVASPQMAPAPKRSVTFATKVGVKSFQVSTPMRKQQRKGKEHAR